MVMDPEVHPFIAWRFQLDIFFFESLSWTKCWDITQISIHPFEKKLLGNGVCRLFDGRLTGLKHVSQI